MVNRKEPLKLYFHRQSPDQASRPVLILGTTGIILVDDMLCIASNINYDCTTACCCSPALNTLTPSQASPVSLSESW